MKKIVKAVRFVYLSMITVLLFFCFLFALAQTKWAKETIADAISSAFAENHIQVKMEGVEGSLPFTWHIDRATFKWGRENTLHLNNVKVRFAIFPLLKKTLVASYFNVERAHFSFDSGSVSQSIAFNDVKKRAQELSHTLSISKHLVIHRLKIDALTCENLLSKKTALYSLIADIDLGKNLRYFSCHAMVSPRGHPDNMMQIQIEGDPNRDAFIELKSHLTSLDPFQVFYPFSSLNLLNFHFSLSGKWTAWSAFFNNQPMPSSLSGFLNAEIDPQSPIAILNRPWNIHTDLALLSPQSVSVSSSAIHSDLCEIVFAGTLQQDLMQSSMHLTWTLPDLSLFDSTQISGSAKGEALFAQGRWKGALFTGQAAFKGLQFDQLAGHFSAERTERGWEGHSDIKTQGGPLPLNNTFDFLYRTQQLSLYGFSLEGPGLILAGDLSMALPHFLFSGALYGHIDHLHSLSFLMQDRSMDASLGAECQFSNEKEKQTVRCSLLGKNFLSGNQTMDAASLTFTVSDLYGQPTGNLHLLAEGLHSPFYDIQTMDFATASDEEQEWPFSLQVQGDMQEPFSVFAQGRWKKENELLSVETDTLSGKVLSQPIVLQSPFLLEIGREFLSSSPIDMIIGSGLLFGTFDFSPERSTAQIDLEHFPIRLLSLFYPNYNLEGSISLKGYIDASDANMQGSFTAFLEEAHFQHSINQEFFQTKGNLQAHIDHGIMQVHAHLDATQEQFIDFAASLPLSYRPYPFHFAFPLDKPISSELIAEGRLQDLFAYLPLGIHQFTGYVSARLFLSQTLRAPDLQGKIDWQEGTYENFLTGTALSDIRAEMRAAHNTVQLTSFSAKDDKKGSMTAEGNLILNPKKNFPYQFIAELDKLHSVHFNPLDCHLCGPLYITGTTREALAQGNLIVSQAEFTIPDKLPSEIPVLPITFVNRPLTLASSTLLPSSAFAFRLNLELTAEDHVQVTGKGLSSEWKGNLLVHGTNMNVLANGSLQLIKGEYDLLGKKFKLTDGQILFNDKPSASATINLSGNLSLSDTLITAHLRGPLSSPTLTFQSNPQMSTSAILARILFNKNISDISQPEAIQLATTLISLSGSAGPHLLETIRKNIGVDRLAIASQTAHPDEIAVQIGKYLTKGVLITLSQSATSSQVIVEVEFNYGFVFQAETQEEQEGKFSLKWTHSY